MLKLPSGRVLFVDDHAPTRESYAKMARRMGYSAEVAESGLAALDHVASCYFPVIVTDLRMPGLHGLRRGFLLRLRKTAA